MLNRLLITSRIIFPRFYCFKRDFKVYGNVLSLSERELIQDIFPSELKADASNLFLSQSQTVYAGFDPTADSLHIGNLLVLIGLLHVQRMGHQPIAIVGGATGKVGDPSGRKTERVLLDNQISNNNVRCISQQIENIFINHNKYLWDKRDSKKLLILNNEEWYRNATIIDFVTQVGNFFRLGEMLSRSSVQARIKSHSGMSFQEFCYQLFQAYDWLHLFKSYGCLFQLGGCDQMGNINTGHDLISKSEKVQTFGITLPIVTNEEGDKFGKSAGQAVWLDPSKTSPYSFYQFFIRQPDTKVETFLKLFTFMELEDIRCLMEEHKINPEKRKPQKKLASNLTLLVHGEEHLKRVESTSTALFEGNIKFLENLQHHEIRDIFKGAAYQETVLDPNESVLNFSLKIGCFASERDAQRIISAGGFYINMQRITNILDKVVYEKHVMKNGLSLIRACATSYRNLALNLIILENKNKNKNHADGFLNYLRRKFVRWWNPREKYAFFEEILENLQTPTGSELKIWSDLTAGMNIPVPVQFQSGAAI